LEEGGEFSFKVFIYLSEEFQENNYLYHLDWVGKTWSNDTGYFLSFIIVGS